MTRILYDAHIEIDIFLKKLKSFRKLILEFGQSDSVTCRTEETANRTQGW
jgi:hypothetical protein